MFEKGKHRIGRWAMDKLTELQTPTVLDAGFCSIRISFSGSNGMYNPSESDLGQSLRLGIRIAAAMSYIVFLRLLLTPAQRP